MSWTDLDRHPSLPTTERRVCRGCIDDPDLAEFIRAGEERGTCDFCVRKRTFTLEVRDIARHIEERIRTFYGRAVDQLPYESAEGGYQGANYDTYDLIVDEIGLGLPNDHDGELLTALVEAIGDEQWCAYDWTQLEIDESLAWSWKEFCETIKHKRRFFFHDTTVSSDDDPDSRSPKTLLRELKSLLGRSELVVEKGAGYRLFHARPRDRGERHRTPGSLSPPPADKALQANRMNPVGIPMFYAAENVALTRAEMQGARVSIGKFETTKPIRLLDLVDLPAVPGFFSDSTRSRRQHLAFLHSFAGEISKPVPRDERVHLDYLPTQVFTEFLRDESFDGAAIDGVRYPSATGKAGANVVLFATQAEVIGALPVEEGAFGRSLRPWLRLLKTNHSRRGLWSAVE